MVFGFAAAVAAMNKPKSREPFRLISMARHRVRAYLAISTVEKAPSTQMADS